MHFQNLSERWESRLVSKVRLIASSAPDNQQYPICITAVNALIALTKKNDFILNKHTVSDTFASQFGKIWKKLVQNINIK